MSLRLKLIAGLLLILVLVSAFLLDGYYGKVDLGNRTVTVIIKEGDSFSGVAEKLLDEKVVRSSIMLSFPARLREIVRARGGVMQEMCLDELPVVLSSGSDRVKVRRLPWVLLVDAGGRIRHESTGADLSELTVWLDFLKRQPVTDIDESTWGKIKELFR